ncbi:MAG: blue (type 1) copper domain protein [Solirubrobacterales bacterium]|nr:blue (type 1) copper domain protein [Solirubrobacterales bacterium]
MTAKRLILPFAAAGALVVAGCGSSSSSSSTTPAASSSTSASSSSTPATSSSTSSSTPASSSSTPATSTPAASGKDVSISMKNIAFDPKSVTAKVGQTVIWKNDDTVDHNVVATSGETFKSANFGQGATYKYKLDKPGTIKYVCTIHPGMDGTIVVK